MYPIGNTKFSDSAVSERSKLTSLRLQFNQFINVIFFFSGRKFNCVLYGVLYGVDCLSKVLTVIF